MFSVVNSLSTGIFHSQSMCAHIQLAIAISIDGSMRTHVSEGAIVISLGPCSESAIFSSSIVTRAEKEMYRYKEGEI